MLVVEHKPETIAIADHVVDLAPAPVPRAAPSGSMGRWKGCGRTPRPAATSTTGRLGVSAFVAANDGGPRRVDEQPADVDVDIRSGCSACSQAWQAPQEPADPGLGRGPRRRGGRPGGDPRLTTEQPGDLHRPARPDPQGVCEGHPAWPALFSSNSEGACPTQRSRRHLHRPASWPPSSPPARSARKRFQALGAGVHAGGRNIADVLAMSVTEAEAFFDNGEARTPAAHRTSTGSPTSGRVPSLGQPLTTLSGGERQRLKPRRWRRRGTSTSSTSRPPASTSPTWRSLLGLLDRLVDSASRSSSSSTTRR